MEYLIKPWWWSEIQPQEASAMDIDQLAQDILAALPDPSKIPAATPDGEAYRAMVESDRAHVEKFLSHMKTEGAMGILHKLCHWWFAYGAEFSTLRKMPQQEQ